MVILGAQMKVAQQDCRFRAGDNKDDKDQKEKSVHVVDLCRPNRAENEKQLNKDTTKRKDSTHYDPWQRLCVKALIGYLSGNLVSSDGMFHGTLTKSKKCSNKC